MQSEHELSFAIDIDGTLTLSHQEIPGASEALNLLNDRGIPYMLVTNNISKSEQTKADELNKLFTKLKKPIEPHQIILNITPLKKYIEWGEKIMLIVMREKEAKSRLPFE
jgi:ribonucleotide monophosphatase NagD (HAD superfamily)